jgi:proteasome lid subunit RPN8/RPN11/molybdopterin converting factor small subunit
MINVTVYIPTPLRRLTSGAAHVPIEIAPDRSTLAELVDRIDGRFPGLKDELWAGDDFKHYVNVYVNGDEVRARAGAATRLAEGDQVAFIPMLAGGGEALEVAQAILDDIYAHAAADYPNECCGLLSGTGLAVRRGHRMRNVEASPVVYLMDPKEQLTVFDRIDRDGEELIAIYHSHTHSAAYPSPTDVRLAYYPESVYVIVSLADRAKPVARAFRIVDGAIAEMEVAVR